MEKLNPENMSKLGFGMMRLPLKDEVIDIEQVKEMVDRYIDRGFNYFDTAYVYHGGKSEEAIREAIVNRYPRESFIIADKLPVWAMQGKEDRDRIFNEQLERLGTDYIDMYLLHSVEDSHIENYEKFDCFNWAVQKKEEGKIRHFGFSYHGTPEMLEKILDRHPEVEFVQIQLNYADWNNPVVQSGKLYDILTSRNIPIIVMEPVKGGTLASLDDELADRLTAADPNRSIASWALRFVGSLPGVMTILSGMSAEGQMEDNLNTFADFKPLDEKEHDTVIEVRDIMLNRPTVPCTACSYCTDGCPEQIDIPTIFKALNARRLYPNDNRPNSAYKNATKERGKASDCIACGQCESVCPQHLNIIELIAEAAEKFEQQ